MNLINQKVLRRLWVGALTLSTVVLMPLSLGACASAQGQKNPQVHSEESPNPSSEAEALQRASASLQREQYYLMDRGGSGRMHR